MSKLRVDQLLVDLGYYPTREKAKRALLAGLVYVNDQQITKPGQQFLPETEFIIKEEERYVSRGGYKLETAIDSFDLCLHGMVAADIGSSTGGFTDCMLKSGVTKVYAIDVGKGLISWELRNDSRVILMEGINARYLKESDLPQKVNLMTIDVSFISIKKVLPAVLNLLTKKGTLLALIKPQFEAKKNQVGKNGIVKDESLIQEILDDMIVFFNNNGLIVNGRVRVPIIGKNISNKEYMMWAEKQ